MKPLNCLIAVILLLCSAGARADHQESISPAELDALLAPVALYPDTVLSQLLIAASYPLDIVQAARWSRAHPGLRGQAAVSAVEQRDWDPSVKALVAFPDLLSRMDEDLEWTERVGEVFLLAEEEVTDSIQRLRRRAHAAGHLRSGEHLQVLHERTYILIEPPLHSHVVYLPFYDTRVVYGHWWWPARAPHWWACPGGHYPRSGFFWSSAIRLSSTHHFSSFHWSRRQVVVLDHQYRPSHRPRYWGHYLSGHAQARHWQHRPHRRDGAAFREPRLDRPQRQHPDHPHTGRQRQDAQSWRGVDRPGHPEHHPPRNDHARPAWRTPAHQDDHDAQGRPRHDPSHARPQPKPALRADHSRHNDRPGENRAGRHGSDRPERRDTEPAPRRSPRDYR